MFNTFMAAIFAAMVCAMCIFVAAGPAVADVAWKPNKIGGLTASSNDHSQHWGLSVVCNPSTGFNLVLIMDRELKGRIVSVAAKVGSGKSIVLKASKDQTVPEMIRLTGLDALQNEFLQRETLSLKISTAENDAIAHFMFPGVRTAANQIKKLCPPF